MHRPARLAHGDADRLAHGLGDLALLQAERRLGDRLEQRVMVDPHLDAPAELVGVQVAGDGDHRRAVEPGVADAGGKIGRAGAERGDAQPGLAGHAAGDVGGEARRALMRGEHELDAALAHGLHQRQHVAARDAEAAVDAGGFEGCDDQIGIVHGKTVPRVAVMYVTAVSGCSRGIDMAGIGYAIDGPARPFGDPGLGVRQMTQSDVSRPRKPGPKVLQSPVTRTRSEGRGSTIRLFLMWPITTSQIGGPSVPSLTLAQPETT